MKFICNTQDLCEGVTNVQRAVSSKATLPALEGILIATDGDKIILSGYDLEIAIKTTVEANVGVEGCIVVKAHVFSEIIKKAHTETVSIEVDDNMNMIVRYGGCAFSIAAIDANEYPELPPIEENDSIEIDGELLHSMVSETIFSVSQSDDKPVHTGILFEISEGNIRLVAVDSTRFAIRNERIGGDKSMRFIIPAKTLSEVLKLIDDGDSVKISIDSRHVSFNIGKFLVISRLLDGDFLDYTSIPDIRTTIATINTQDFVASIDRMSPLIVERLSSPVRCTFEDNSVYLKCETALGKASDTIDCTIDGEQLEIGFNSRYMIEALRAIEDEEIKIAFGGPNQAIRILPIEGDCFHYLIMPIRLKESR